MGRAYYDPRTNEPVRMVGTIADIDARKRTEEQLEQTLAEKNESLEMLEVVNATGQSLAAELDMDRLVQGVTDAATRMSRASFGAFFYNVTDEHGQALLLYTLSGAPKEAFSKFPLPRATSVFAATFQGAQIVRSDDITADARYGKNAPYRGMPEGHLPVRSYMAVPVIARSGEVIGGLFFGTLNRACSPCARSGSSPDWPPWLPSRWTTRGSSNARRRRSARATHSCPSPRMNCVRPSLR